MSENSSALIVDKTFEMWAGSLYSSDPFYDVKKIDKKRDLIAKSVREYFENNYSILFKDIFDKIEQLDRGIEYKPIIRDGKVIRDADGLEVKLLRFPRLKIKINSLSYILGIRINICAGENLSKIWLYIHPEENNSTKLNSEQIFETIQNLKDKLDKVHSRIGEDYQKLGSSEDFNFKIYVYNIGSISSGSFLSEKDFGKIANLIKTDKVIRRNYLDILGLIHNKYFKSFEEFKNFKQPKNHSWGLRRLIEENSTNETITLFAQKISEDEGRCQYSGFSNTNDIKSLHEMDRSVILGILNQF